MRLPTEPQRCLSTRLGRASGPKGNRDLEDGLESVLSHRLAKQTSQALKH